MTVKHWEAILQMALFTLRIVKQKNVGFSPAKLVHVKNLKIPRTLVYKNWLEQESVEE